MKALAKRMAAYPDKHIVPVADSARDCAAQHNPKGRSEGKKRTKTEGMTVSCGERLENVRN